MKMLGTYTNGNYTVEIYDDGTKIRETEADEFISAFPENIDIKITNQCDKGCLMCHEGSTINGKHGDIMDAAFIDTLHPWTELAIGGGNPLAHPDLIPFLEKLKERDILANITVNQDHFEKNQNLIRRLTDEKLIYGLGVSLVSPTENFITLLTQYDNAVLHVINGFLDSRTVDALANKGIKMLILGYKQFRRGAEFYKEETSGIEYFKHWLSISLPLIIDKFKVVSFDNLAIEQLRVKSLLSTDKWNEFYMGDDGKFTMYIDMVNKKFARCSVAEQRYDLLDNIDEMFSTVKMERSVYKLHE